MDQIGGSKWWNSLTVVFFLAKWIVLFLVALLLIHLFVATIFMVDGPSMEPTLYTKQIMLVNRLAYLTNTPKRGDVVVMRFPGDPVKSRYVKRIVGMPNDDIAIHDGAIYINNKALIEPYIPFETYTDTSNITSAHLKANEYFLVGDHREVSSDSRIWGPARKEDLIGRTTFILFPFGEAGYIPHAYYK